MFKKIFICLFACVALNAGETMILQSKNDFETTYSKVKSEIEKRKIPIFAEFDHAKNATEADLSLSPTKVIVFGNPKVGTFLMQENQAIALELPLKIAVWEDSKGVFVSFSDIKGLQKTYKIKNDKVVGAIESLLGEIVESASKK